MSQAVTPPGDTFVMPASVSQKRFWLLEQMSPGNTALNIPIAFQLSGPLRPDILQRALQAIVDRHEVLRTRFELIDGEPRQIIAPAGTIHLKQIDAGNVPFDQISERTRREMDLEAERLVDFSHPPLLRATLVKLGASEHVLMLTAHHIVSDGWSNGLLVRELAAFYDAFLNDKPVGLSPLAIQYADYVVWQEQWLKTPEFQKQLDHWNKELAGEIPVLDFPTDFPRQTAQVSGAILESLLLPTALTESLKRFCQEEGVTLFMIFFTAYFALLHRYTGQNRLMIGTTAANRNKPELESLIGLFANILVMLSDVPGDMTFRGLLQRQRDQSLGNFANHEVPFEMVLDQLQQKGRLVMQTHFLFQRAFMQPVVCGELHIRPLHSVSPGSTFELTFGIVERSEGIRLQMEYRTSLFEKTTIQRLLRHFQGLLESAVANPETALDDLSLFTGDEREELEAMLAPPGTPPSGTVAETLRGFDKQLERHWQKGDVSFARVDLPVTLMALDSKLRLLPVGIPGDLYLGVSGLNATGFEIVSGPSDAAVPISLIKTGYLGRNGEGGKTELWGRAVDFVRVQGFRFDLRAVEAVLRLHPDIVDVAVAMHPPKLTGYVVMKSGSAMTGEDLRAFLKGKITDLLIPSSIAIVSALPRSAAGELLVDQLSLPVTTTTPAKPDHVPMQGLLHQQLIEIWQRILKVSDITITDNFFECGGNSFLALRMMLEAEKLCGRPLPLSLLLTGATIVDLARYIIESSNESGAGQSFIPVQTKGSRTPLFFLHGDWVGGGFYCHRLSQQLGDDQPFYALPPYHMQEPKISSMAEIAAWHRDALRKQFPRGPYLIGGYCIGATVALELARQLIAEGETVEHLFLVDLPLWGGVWLRGLWPWVDRLGRLQKWDLWRRIKFFDRTVVALSRWLKKPFAAKMETVFRRLGLKHSGPAVASTGTSNEDFGDADILDTLDFSTYFMSYRLHQRAPLSVQSTLFFPQSTSQARLAEACELSKLSPCHIEVVPGNHTTCVSQHTSELAEMMLSRMNSSPR